MINDGLRQISHDRRWRERLDEVPLLSFPQGWKIRISPPFGSVDARFQVQCGDAHVSVYLDWYENAGCWEGPYWEIYPYNDDVYRCDMSESDELIEAIAESIRQQAEE